MKMWRPIPAARKAACCFFLMAALAGSIGCPRQDTQAPGNVSNFLATAGDGEVALSWSNPSADDFAGVKILRKEGAYPSGPDDGTVVYEGDAETGTDTGLTNGTLYYYAIYSYDEVPNYSSGAQAQATPTDASAHAQIIEQFDDTEEMVEDAGIPEDARNDLDGLLQQAETAYRNGDPCAAADALEEYEAGAQTYRQSQINPDIIGAFEELYAAGRRVRYEMISRADSKAVCSGQERVGAVATEVVDEQHNSNTEFEATTTFGEPRLLTARYNGQVFTKVEIPGCDSLTGEPGMPAVPMFRRLIAVPQGAQISVEFTTQDAEVIHVNLLPTQPPPVDAELPAVPGSAPDPSVFADKPFTLNEQAYDTDQDWPAESYRVTELGLLRDFRAFLVEFPAGTYNPTSDALTLYSSANIRTTFEGGSGVFASEIVSSAFESSSHLYTSAFSNRGAVSDYLSDIGAFLNLGEELMILTPPAFRTAADTLATWKNSKGIVTRVFEVGTGTTTDTTAEIVDLIKDEYENARIRPAYVLLLGNTSFIPCHYVIPNGDVGATTIATDYPYAAFGLLGILPRVAVGRLPVRSLTDATFVVDRIVDYEEDPPVNTDFYAHAAIAAQFQCCYWEAYSIGTLGTDQRTFILSAEFARNTMMAAGKTVDRIYRETVDDRYEYDTTPRRYHDGTALPTDIGPGSGFDWNSDAADVSAAWNAGRFLILHRDHGWPGGWGDPAFIWSDVDALTNGNLLPVVFSVNCASGLFDQETAGGAMSTMAGIPYFAERLLTNANGGAIGVLGDTRNSPTWANSALTRGFFDAIWPTAISDFGTGTSVRRLGDILNHSKLYLLGQAGISGTNVTWNDVGDEFKMWHCLGDPTLELWTTNPNRGILSSVADLRFDAQVLFADYATEGANLTLFRPNVEGNEPIGRGTVANGVARFELVGTPQPGENLLVAATLPNAPPEEIQVVVPETTPPGNVTNFAATVGQLIQVTLTWGNPGDSDFAGVRIQRKQGGYPTSPTDGITVYDGPGTQYVDNDVLNNNTYYYKAFAYDSSGNFASGAQSEATLLFIG